MEIFLCERILVEIHVKHPLLMCVQVAHDTHIHAMDIVAAGLLTADGVVAVTEQFNETRLFHAAVHYFLYIEFSHGGQQPEKFVIDVLITAHMLMRAAHLPKKRDGQIGLSSSFYFFVGCLLHKKTPATCATGV